MMFGFRLEVYIFKIYISSLIGNDILIYGWFLNFKYIVIINWGILR